jgi:phenylacetyl-CoA:acceptor oxidoreductase
LKTPFARDFDMPSANSLVPMHVDFLDGSGGTVDATKANVRRAGAARR